VEGR
jgi:hypothetical protein